MSLTYGGVTYDGGVSNSGNGTTTSTSTSTSGSKSSGGGFDWGSLFGSLGGILNGGANVVNAVKGSPMQYNDAGQAYYPPGAAPETSRSLVIYIGAGVVLLGLVYFLFMRK